MSSSGATKNRGKRRAMAALATGVALGFGSAASAQSPDKGRELAERLCASCHLNPGQGEKAGPRGIPGFAAVANRPKQTHEAVVHWLLSVPPMMPDHHLTQDEAYELADFIMSLRKE